MFWEFGGGRRMVMEVDRSVVTRRNDRNVVFPLRYKLSEAKDNMKANNEPDPEEPTSSIRSPRCKLEGPI